MLPPTLRSDHYVPGNSYGWTVFDVSVDEPLIIRAAGIVRAGGDIAEPNGLTASAYERDLGPARSDSTQYQRVLATAPYLALIGRVCARRSCSPPFLVGTSAVVCPSRLGVTGQLQLWTNNYVRINGTQTVANYSRVSGGFTFISETGPTEICNGQPALAGRAGEMLALESGGTLKGPHFKVSSRQSVWKPFFLPLDKPILIRATGEMAPRNDALTTGPDGIVVPPTSRWIYPGTTDIVVDSQHALFEPSLPYQALIGRFCSTTECGRPFLVGSERVLCPAAPYTDRLELRYNHIIHPPTMLGRASLTFDAFDIQSRSGEYRFEVSRASEGLCAAR